MSSRPLETVVIDPPSPPTHTVIWLHGLGADGHDFEPIAPELALPASWQVRFVFPHAPYMPVTINRGFVMRAWYDVLSDDIDRHADLAGVRASVTGVTALLEQEIARGVPASHVVLAGFSQGGVIALEVGARFREGIGGIIALSTYVADTANFPAATPASPPIFMAHGTYDNIVRHPLGVASRQALEAKGYKLTWREYAMLHSVCAEEIEEIGEWLRTTLPPG